MKTDYSAEEWKDLLTGESLLLAVLGKLLYSAPNRDWLEELIHSGIFAEAPFGGSQPLVQRGFEMMQAWCEQNRQNLTDDHYADLQEDYLRLFIGLDKVLAPVWESVYFNEEHLVFQEQTYQVRVWYRRFGAEIENFRKEPDDHIGLELIFVAFLAQRALENLQRKDEQAFEEDLRAQRNFLDEHLLRFAPNWFDLVEQHAATDFYRALGHLIWGSLQEVDEMLHNYASEGAAV